MGKVEAIVGARRKRLLGISELTAEPVCVRPLRKGPEGSRREVQAQAHSVVTRESSRRVNEGSY
jgi:hypothetical protein